MSYASRVGRARVSSVNPEALAVCDRCGIWHNLVDLQFQFEWGGASLYNTRFLVCRRCLDVPSEQLRSIVLPPDPTPIINPRVEPFLVDESNYMGFSGSTTDPVTGIPVPSTTTMGTVGGTAMTPEPIGRPRGLDQDAIPPLAVSNGAVVRFGLPVPVLSVISNGTDQIAVTCSTPHGLATDDQISVEGLSNVHACGFFSVTVTSAMAFTYQTFSLILAASLLGAHTRMVTCLVGLPLDTPQIPQVGP